MSTIYQNRALCVVVSVLNKCTMTRNSMTDMVIEASDVGGAAGGTRGVVGGSIEVASGIDGAAGADDAARTGGTDYVGCLSYYGCSVYGGTGDTGLGGAAIGAE